MHQAQPLPSPTPRRASLRIYQYELPTELAHEHAYHPFYKRHDPVYTAYQKFASYFSADWAVRTEDPNEANLFYVPALTYWYSTNQNDINEHLKRVVNHVKTKFPFWGRAQGRDHFFWLPNDRGACYIEANNADLQKSIKVVHFGLYDKGGSEINPKPTNPDYGCYNPVRDVVAPPYFDQAAAAADETFGAGAKEKAKIRLLYFAGGCWAVRRAGGSVYRLACPGHLMTCLRTTAHSHAAARAAPEPQTPALHPSMLSTSSPATGTSHCCTLFHLLYPLTAPPPTPTRSWQQGPSGNVPLASL